LLFELPELPQRVLAALPISRNTLPMILHANSAVECDLQRWQAKSDTDEFSMTDIARCVAVCSPPTPTVCHARSVHPLSTFGALTAAIAGLIEAHETESSTVAELMQDYN
jgi:hypothetical protein